jgi:hypothetical protein
MELQVLQEQEHLLIWNPVNERQDVWGKLKRYIMAIEGFVCHAEELELDVVDNGDVLKILRREILW